MSTPAASLANRAPQRTCVGCGAVSTKRDILRLVRTPGGSIELDPSGKKGGRGAYLCNTPECREAGLKPGRLERALKTKISPEDRARLQNELSQVAGDKGNPSK